MPDEKFSAAAIRAAGYGAVWHGEKSWNGVAILARGGEPTAIHRGLPNDRAANQSIAAACPYCLATALWIALQWWTRFGWEATNCCSGVSIS